MKTLFILLLLVSSCVPAAAQQKPAPTPNYITKTAPNYMSPKYETSKPSGKSESKSCVTVVEQNFFTKQPVQTVKCY